MVERKPCAQDRAYHHLVGHAPAGSLRQRSCDLYGLIVKVARYLIGHYLAYPVEIEAEPHRILLNIHRAHLQHILVDQALMICEIIDFHRMPLFLRKY